MRRPCHFRPRPDCHRFQPGLLASALRAGMARSRLRQVRRRTIDPAAHPSDRGPRRHNDISDIADINDAPSATELLRDHRRSHGADHCRELLGGCLRRRNRARDSVSTASALATRQSANHSCPVDRSGLGGERFGPITQRPFRRDLLSARTALVASDPRLCHPVPRYLTRNLVHRALPLWCCRDFAQQGGKIFPVRPTVEYHSDGTTRDSEASARRSPSVKPESPTAWRRT